MARVGVDLSGRNLWVSFVSRSKPQRESREANKGLGRITLANPCQPRLNGMKTPQNERRHLDLQTLLGRKQLQATGCLPWKGWMTGSGGEWGGGAGAKSPEGGAKSHAELFSGSKTQSRNCQHVSDWISEQLWTNLEASHFPS